ncbi:MAG: hypothetical protein ACJ74J_03845 [Blastocatellia bacterium]
MNFRPDIATRTILVILLAVAPAAAFQDAAKKEDEAKARAERRKGALMLTDEIIRTAQSLRLPENRLRLFVQTANIIWSVDEKRARLLIKNAQQSLNELRVAMDSNDPQYTYLSAFAAQLRQEMLYMLSQRDPELALEVMQTTRQSSAGQFPQGQGNYDAQLEMQLAHSLAAKSPAKAVELAERGLANGVSGEVVNIVNALSGTDRDAAQKLLNETLARLRTENYATNPSAASVAVNLLLGWVQHHNQPAANGEAVSEGIWSLRFNEQTALALCSAITQAVSDDAPGNRLNWNNGLDLLRQLQPALPTIEKLAPAQAAALKARFAEWQRFADMQNGPWGKVQELINTSSVSELLNAATSYPPDTQTYFMQQAAWKAYNEGNHDLARQIIQEKIADPGVRRDMEANIDRQMVDRMINEGKVAQARGLLSRMGSAAERVAFLTRLANLAIEKGDKNEAQQLLSEAQAQAGIRADSYQMLYAQLEVARAYRSLDPQSAYSIIEATIARLNELTNAAATLNGFDVQQYFRNDEFVLANGNMLNMLLQQIGGQVGGIAEKDMDRARGMAERVERLEMKAFLFLTMLPALLDGDESKAESLHVLPGRTFRLMPLNGPRRADELIAY